MRRARSDSPPSADTSVTLDQMLCYSVYSAGHALTRVYKPLLAPLGLTYPQYLVMVALWADDGATVGELGELLSLESNTLTPLLKRLEADGRLRRTRDPADERQVRIRLTEDGRALRRRAAQIPGCILTASGLSLAELGRLRGEISRLRASLENFQAPS